MKIIKYPDGSSYVIKEVFLPKVTFKINSYERSIYGSYAHFMGYKIKKRIYRNCVWYNFNYCGHLAIAME
jgi:hypothetical protein